MKKVVLESSRSQWVTIVLGLPLTLVSLLLLIKENSWQSWGGALLFGAGLATAIYNLLTKEYVSPSSPRGKKMMEEDFAARLQDDGIFTFHTDGFELEIESKELKYRWDDVVKIIAYKADLLTVDEICLEVFLRDGEMFRISEETWGYYQFMEHAKREITGLLPGWELKVVHPAFERNETILIDR